MYMMPKIVFRVLVTSNIDLPLSIAVSFTLQQYQKSSACIIGPHNHVLLQTCTQRCSRIKRKAFAESSFNHRESNLFLSTFR